MGKVIVSEFSGQLQGIQGIVYGAKKLGVKIFGVAVVTSWG